MNRNSKKPSSLSSKKSSAKQSNAEIDESNSAFKTNENVTKTKSNQSVVNPFRSNTITPDTRQLIAKITGIGHLVLPKGR